MMNRMQRLFSSLVLTAILAAPLTAQNQVDPEAILADKSFVTPASDIADMVLAIAQSDARRVVRQHLYSRA